MSNSKRLSQSLTGSWTDSVVQGFIIGSDGQADAWTEAWRSVFARDLIESRVVSVDAETSVEDACEKLLTEDITCLAVRSHESLEADAPDSTPYHGLFDFSDVNAFLTLAATRHTFSLDDTNLDPRQDNIITAAKAGHVPVYLVSNLSDKNPLVSLPHDSNVISLLEVFARGTHRVLIQSPDGGGEPIGMISDRGLLGWFDSYAKATPTFNHYLTNQIQPLSLPSLKIHTSVVAVTSSSSVLDAMRLMSEEGVSSVAVLDEETGALLSAVSVTDVGKVVVPSQSNQILNTPLHQFISYIKDSDGSTDGADKYPVYSVLPSSQLQYTIEKLLATNAHRLFIARESTHASPVLAPASLGNLCGIVSIVDILSLFARLAKVPNVDPTEMQRHRRMSSASSQSSTSRGAEPFSRSRSGSNSVRRSPSVTSSPPGPAMIDPATARSAIPSLDSIVTLERRKSQRASKGQ